MAREARRLGMGVLVDIVPNHVGVATPAANPWWWDVLKHGRHGEHAAAFDIDWNRRRPTAADPGRRRRRPEPRRRPGRPPRGGGRPDGEPELRYHDHRFPVAPGTADDWGKPGIDAQTVHARQHYELVNWRVADDGLNYRRFFAVNTLAAVRVEEPEVFDDTHVRDPALVHRGPGGRAARRPPRRAARPGPVPRRPGRACTGGAYVLVEKILEPGEQLPSSWATAGTTGYDALAHIDRVLTDPDGQEPLDALEARLRGAPVDWHEMVHSTKREVADNLLHSEVRRIVARPAP